MTVSLRATSEERSVSPNMLTYRREWKAAMVGGRLVSGLKEPQSGCEFGGSTAGSHTPDLHCDFRSSTGA